MNRKPCIAEQGTEMGERGCGRREEKNSFPDEGNRFRQWRRVQEHAAPGLVQGKRRGLYEEPSVQKKRQLLCQAEERQRCEACCRLLQVRGRGIKESHVRAVRGLRKAGQLFLPQHEDSLE